MRKFVPQQIDMNKMVVSEQKQATTDDHRVTKKQQQIRPKRSVIGSNDLTSRAANGNSADDSNIMSRHVDSRPIVRPIRYYIDELGFYRHLDPDKMQYVCSNLNAVIMRGASPMKTTNGVSDDNNNKTRNGQLGPNHSDGEDFGQEICFRTMRRHLGISHFDRIEDYANWKREWDEFMRLKLNSTQPVTLNGDLKNRVRSGIPHDYRCKVWSALIKMRTRAIRNQFGDDIYEAIVRDFVLHIDYPDYSSATTGATDQMSVKSNMTTTSVNRAMRSTSPKIHVDPWIDKCFKQIELDLLRTLPNNRHFENPNSRGIQRVRRILRAYAYFNQAVGYCQGMNRLAAMALLVLPEEEAFWCLVSIVQCIMPKDYYLKPWLAQVDCCVLSDLMEKKMPKLHKHLIKNDIQLTLFTWFFTIFVDGFRPELMLRIWDCFLLEGDKVLFRFALAILFTCQEDLLQMHDFSAMSSYLNSMVTTRRLDVEHLFSTFKTINPLSSATIDSRREYHINRLKSVMEEPSV